MTRSRPRLRRRIREWVSDVIGGLCLFGFLIVMYFIGWGILG